MLVMVRQDGDGATASKRHKNKNKKKNASRYRYIVLVEANGNHDIVLVVIFHYRCHWLEASISPFLVGYCTDFPGAPMRLITSPLLALVPPSRQPLARQPPLRLLLHPQ